MIDEEAAGRPRGPAPTMRTPSYYYIKGEKVDKL